jgi:urease accessory protein UreE
VLLDSVVSLEGPWDDEIEIAWWELDRRAFEKRTLAGLTARVLLPRDVDLRHGMILAGKHKGIRIGIRVKPCEVLVVTPPDASAMGLLALELGNLHIPTEIINDTLRTVPDGPAEQAINELGLIFERQVVRFHPRRCAGAPQVLLSGSFRVVRS